MIDREKIARALWESEPVIYSWGPQERHHVSWDAAVERNLAGVAIFRAFADAALLALGLQPGGPNQIVPREPTEAMIIAGNKPQQPFGTYLTGESTRARYRAMLTAAEDARDD